MSLNLSDEELIALLEGHESDRVEFKESVGKDKDKLCQAICAFANDLPDYKKPGVIFIGIDNAGNCSNLNITDELLETLGAIRSDGNILPLPTMSVQKRKLKNCEVAVILVTPAIAPPVRYEGRVWIRVGPRRALASAQDESRLIEKSRFNNQAFDIHPIPMAKFDDLDLSYFRNEYLPYAISPDVLAQNERPIEHQLASLRFLTPDGQPTLVGIFTCGKNPRYFLPSAYVQFVRFEGTELTDPIKDQKELDGRLVEVLRELDELLNLHISVSSNIAANPLEVKTPDYPLTALLQLVRNALMHRSYENTNAPIRIYWFNDRIEIFSPGGPYGNVTPENFGMVGLTDYRNPHLAEVMKNLGYAQRFGAGIPIARKALAENGNPDLKFQAIPSHILAILRKK